MQSPTMLPHSDTPRLLQRVAAGDSTAVRECIAKFGGIVWALARRFDPGDAEDAAQEIFLDLWKSAARYDAAIGSEATFVAMIARRRLIDRKRSRARRPETEQLVELAHAVVDPTAIPDSLEASRAAAALQQLRPEQREVLLLSTCHGLSHGEIAARTGMPLGTVKAHARRGLLSIREAISSVRMGET